MRTLTVAVMMASGVLGACAGDEPDYSETGSNIDVDQFVLPTELTFEERAELVRKYDALDPDDLVPRGLLEDAVLYYDMNLALIPKQRYLVVIDFSLFSGKDRFWLVDVMRGEVESHKVAHGDGSDPDHDGYATSFSNVSGSHKSSLGYYLTGEVYDGSHLHSMRLDGLSKDGSPNGMANTNARSRLIVMHEASYVDDDNDGKQGRSNGCPALDPTIHNSVVDKIFAGSLIYAATKPLAPPVGRASCGDGLCDGAETVDACPMDCNDGGDDDGPADDPDPTDDGGDPMPEDEVQPGGCAAGGGTTSGGLALVLALAVRRRRRV